MQALFDRDHPAEAWKRLVRPGEMVSLKVNALGGRGISTRPELVEAICERLQQAGIRLGKLWSGTATATNSNTPDFTCRPRQTACSAWAPIAPVTSRIWPHLAVLAAACRRF